MNIVKVIAVSRTLHSSTQTLVRVCCFKEPRSHVLEPCGVWFELAICRTDDSALVMHFAGVELSIINCRSKSRKELLDR
ncbi:hypothetical protein T4A_9437 [Trichinella pseudospiralis]|uniref:Uncharacterized protein n=1 Tax=Trichinella pseudospiralis TaxID=6337 RepID=A0A0V1E7L5_TRIPS|nr:hypothetical protein T4A_9437 [Trichinella pseudospiralis]